jgi:hypothetical protein
MTSKSENFARVVIPSPLKQPLIYAVPEGLREHEVTLVEEFADLRGSERHNVEG